MDELSQLAGIDAFFDDHVWVDLMIQDLVLSHDAQPTENRSGAVCSVEIAVHPKYLYVSAPRSMSLLHENNIGIPPLELDQPDLRTKEPG